MSCAFKWHTAILYYACAINVCVCAHGEWTACSDQPANGHMQFSTTEAAVVGFRIFDVSVLIPAVYIAVTRFCQTLAFK